MKTPSSNSRLVRLAPGLPTALEINPIPEDLDGRNAQEHFFGKTLEEAEALFRDNSLYYQEDLMFMGMVAFRFYVQAAIRYIRSDQANEDSDMVSAFASILELRLKYDRAEVVPIAPLLADACGYILDHYDRFDLVPEIYGDLRPRYQDLQQAFWRLQNPAS